MKIRIIAAAAFLFAGNSFASDIVISDFNWYQNDGYCHFHRPDRTFNFDDPKTWRYVFMSNLPFADFDNPPATAEELAKAKFNSFEPAFMMIDHGFHEMAIKTASEADGKLKIVYTTYGDKPYEVVLEAEKGEKGYESQAFAGTITVRRDGASASVSFKGDCGV
ncbi:hypothetical protein [Rhizobium sp. L1K21]|uniref:hypothetical protein n=1 Tax=Rhizobium sp. L1K21 TaxID=2954933 RepID=UPI002093CD18|nr:hypothetical protein [Rhizobium sp. L1K21]MCO6184903.1 hypothetical protein [Rhizobium sp. L1K21]